MKRTVDSFEKINEKNVVTNENTSHVDMDLIFVLDKSGSMSDSVEDTIGGFNSFIRRERVKNPNTRVTLVLFNDEYEILYTRKPIADVEALTGEEYFACGCTALLDAVGHTIVSFDKEVNNKVLFVITTDGLENASEKYSRADVKNLIKNHDWEFLFIGADIDSYAEASSIGIERERSANYEKCAAGFGALFDSVSSFKESYEECEEDEEVGDDWKKGLF
jgi:hypothetical protein